MWKTSESTPAQCEFMKLTEFFQNLENEIRDREDLVEGERIRFRACLSVVQKFIASTAMTDPQLLQKDLFCLLNRREEFSCYKSVLEDSELFEEFRRLVSRVF